MMQKNRVVLVTGSTQGIGKATAMAFYDSGSRVVFTGRSSEKLKSIEKKIMDHSRASFNKVDFLRKDSCKALVDRIVQKWGRIDVLINNCGGIVKTGQFLDLDEDDWRSSFELNLMTAVTMSKLVIPLMKRKGGGRVVNISSFTALQPGSFNPHYSASKMALINLTKHLSLQYAKDNILVNAVSPGNILTEGWASYVREKSLIAKRKISKVSKEEKERIINGIPLHRFGKPEEVAELIKYICSDAGKFLTGSNFVIDGGKVRGT